MGIKNFASTVGLNYFTYTDFYDERIKNLLSKLRENNCEITKYDIFKKYENLDFSQSINHNIILNLLYSYFKNFHDTKYLDVYKDNNYLIDRTPYIEIDNVKITQDRVNSTLEYFSIKKIIEKYPNNINILEIGAGSGRTTEAILSFEKNKLSKYFVVDIPPALYINYDRLKSIFPQKKIKIAININTVNEIEKLIDENDVILLFPHQLELLKKLKFKIEIFIAIDCLHEMNKKTIKFYMDYVNFLSDFLYFKIWDKTHVAYEFNNYLSASNEASYHINSNWEKIFKNECIFPGNYFDFCFKIKKK